MMMPYVKKSIFCLVMYSVSANVLASDGLVNYTGEIIENACTVTNNMNNPLRVVIGFVARSAINRGKGTIAAPTRFSIELTDCPESLIGTNAHVKFDGTPAPEDNSVLALSEGPFGTATGVGIQLLEAPSSGNQSTVIPLHQASAAKTLQAGRNVFDFGAQYIALSDNVTAGPANGTASFTIVYN